MSVPHSGSRSLMEHLGCRASEQGMRAMGDWWHFGSHDHLVPRWKPTLHIPVRHPMDVAASWGSRDKSGDVIGSLLYRYNLMFDMLLSDHPYVLYKVEDLPRVAGMGEHVQEDRSVLVGQLQDSVRSAIVRPRLQFFQTFYKDPLDGAGHIRESQSCH